jgi:glutamyl-tRNA synthetase
MTSDKPRFRFAPSPTGFLHVGNAHTALFNWLAARSVGGEVVLRIEDTDELRSTPEAEAVIYEGLRWLGIDWDEGPDVGGPCGPYRQSERLDLYAAHAQRLLDQGRAYYCYCTKEELEQRREEMRQAGIPPRYDGRCRELTPEQVAAFQAEGREPAIMFRMAESGATAWDDLIRGRQEWSNAEMGDTTIVKASGYPTYHFAVVLDDHLMGITHVIRGEDHLSNTPRHLQIMEALGFDPPRHGHLGLILGEDRRKYSKRHGANSVAEFRELGFLPEAMANFLALLGWSPGGEQEILALDEIVRRFRLEDVSRAGSVFEIGKAEWMNGEYIRQTPTERLTDLLLPILQEQELFEADPTPERWAWLSRVVDVMRERMRTLRELGERNAYFFTDDFEYNEQARKKWLSKPPTAETLDKLAERIETLDGWDHDAIEGAVRGLAEELGVGASKVIHPCRAAVTGTTVGPGLFELLELLEQGTVVARLHRGAELSRELVASE